LTKDAYTGRHFSRLLVSTHSLF